MGKDAIAAFLIRRRIVRTPMQHLALGGQAILAPLLFNMNQRPLPRAETKMLNARNGEEVLLAILRYPIISKDTPCGIAFLSTLTV